MLRHLSVKNYTLIDYLEIDFPGGFITVTGETGAGKSIILGALGLVSGGRAEGRMIRDGSRKAVIEAIFDQPSLKLASLFDNNGIDWDDNEVILRREIAPGGRSRAFVNDTPVSIQVLAGIASFLIDIHSQNSNVLLADASLQRDIIDSFAENGEALADCRRYFKAYSAVRSRIAGIRKRRAALEEQRHILQYRADKLKELNPKRGELKELEDTLELLSDSETIRSNLAAAYSAMEGGDANAVSLLGAAHGALSSLNVDSIPGLKDSDVAERLRTAAIEVKDIADTLRHAFASIDFSPARLQAVQTRISRFYETAKELNVPDPEDLAEMMGATSEALESLDDDSPDMARLESEAKELLDKLRASASRLSEVRSTAAESFSRLIEDAARPLGLPNLRFVVDIQKGKIGPDGQDEVSFLCAFNKNQDPMPIARSASGGEISRLMLSVKAVIAERFRLPTIVFDEIDSGVSGEIASRMASMMCDLGSGMQVIAVTHLPQVAARGAHQFKVSKTDSTASTVTDMRLLDEEGRIREIAAMLSGSEVHESALLNARALLEGK